MALGNRTGRHGLDRFAPRIGARTVDIPVMEGSP